MNGVIFGAGPVADYEAVRALLPKAPFYLIAADGGLRHARALGLVPDAFIGDMDSLREEDLPEGAILYPSQKDDTDMMLAVKQAMALGVRKVLLLGGLGGRLDHTYANIQKMCIRDRGWCPSRMRPPSFVPGLLGPEVGNGSTTSAPW